MRSRKPGVPAFYGGLGLGPGPGIQDPVNPAAPWLSRETIQTRVRIYPINLPCSRPKASARSSSAGDSGNSLCVSAYLHSRGHGPCPGIATLLAVSAFSGVRFGWEDASTSPKNRNLAAAVTELF